MRRAGSLQARSRLYAEFTVKMNCDHMRTELARFAEISLCLTGIPAKRAGNFPCDHASPVKRADFLATAHAGTLHGIDNKDGRPNYCNLCVKKWY